MAENGNKPMSTGDKLALGGVLGGLGLTVLGGLFAALGQKPSSAPAPKPGLGKPGCGSCGR
jgi:hypothetical protein